MCTGIILLFKVKNRNYDTSSFVKLHQYNNDTKMPDFMGDNNHLDLLTDSWYFNLNKLSPYLKLSKIDYVFFSEKSKDMKTTQHYKYMENIIVLMFFSWVVIHFDAV